MKYVSYENAKEFIVYVVYFLTLIFGIFGFSRWLLSCIRRGIGLLKRLRDNHPAVRKEDEHELHRHL